MRLRFILESIFFVSQRPLSVRKLATISHAPVNEVRAALKELTEHYSPEHHGIVLLENNDQYQLVTHPDASSLIQTYLNEEVMGELTRPALETLSVIAYRGPVHKSEIEKIRGVNCSLALRNLMIRGLIQEHDDRTPTCESTYTLSMEFLRHLGIRQASEFPDYERLHSSGLVFDSSASPQ